MGRILIKLGENVGTLVRLIVLKFHKIRICFDVIMTSFLFFLNLFLREATLLKAKAKNYVQSETIMLRQTVTLATAIFLFIYSFIHSFIYFFYLFLTGLV